MNDKEQAMGITPKNWIYGALIAFGKEYHNFKGNRDLASKVAMEKVESIMEYLGQAGYQLPPKLKVLDKETIEKLHTDWEEELREYLLTSYSDNEPEKWEDRLLNAQVDYNNRQLKEEK